MLNIQIINGPNLNLTGTRQPHIYGLKSFDELEMEIKQQAPDIKCLIFQSNHEGEIIDCIQSIDGKKDALIINAGGFTHTSVAISDAVANLSVPVIEVHLSNILSREEYRHVSLIAKCALGVISGFGLDSYLLAIHQIKRILKG